MFQNFLPSLSSNDRSSSSRLSSLSSRKLSNLSSLVPKQRIDIFSYNFLYSSMNFKFCNKLRGTKR